MNPLGINPNLSYMDRFNKSDMSLLQFNVNAVQSKLANFMNLSADTNSVCNLVNSTILSYNLDRQMMMEQVMEDLHHLLDLEVLFVRKTFNDQVYDGIAFSRPCIGSMNIVHLHSIFYGAIENLRVNVYESMDDMYKALHKCYDQMQEPGYQVLESINFIDVIKMFH